MNQVLGTILLCLLLTTSCNASNEIASVNTWHEEEDGGLIRWYAEDNEGFHVELVQRPSEQTNAFYLGRGFESEAIQIYSDTCIFHATLSNISTDESFYIDLSNWNFTRKNNPPQSLNLVNDWIKKWEELNVSKEAQIAFRFSQLPIVQEPGPGDWFQGMVSLELDKNEVFDLEVIWLKNGNAKRLVMNNLICASE